MFHPFFEPLESWVPTQAYPERGNREQMRLMRKKQVGSVFWKESTGSTELLRFQRGFEVQDVLFLVEGIRSDL